jgi:ribonuclease E
MLDDNDNDRTTSDQDPVLPTTATGVPDPMEPTADPEAPAAPAKKTAKRATKRTTKKAATTEPAIPAEQSAADPGAAPSAAESDADAATEAPTDAPAKKTAKRATKKAAEKAPAKKAAAKKATAKKTTAKKTTAKKAAKTTPSAEPAVEADAAATPSEGAAGETSDAPAPVAPPVLFKAPEPTRPSRRRKTAASEAPEVAEVAAEEEAPTDPAEAVVEAPDAAADAAPATDAPTTGEEAGDEDEQGANRRRRRRGGRRRRKGGGDNGSDDTADDSAEGASDGTSAEQDADRAAAKKPAQRGAAVKAADAADADEGEGTGTRRRRRRRRSGEDGDGGSDDPEKTVTRVRKPRNAEDEITSVSGSTRLEAKKQRRREGREAGRRRAPIVSEAEFLARREAVDRVMVIRQRKDLTQIAVLEDKVLVEHYVARESQTSLIGNVYLGRVQNVLPSMEAAFVDIGKGRNAVLYAGEVNWDSLGAGNGPRKIEQVLKSGQPILVQVTKDPIGHKGARLTSQISLPGRFLVYVPDGTTSGISRKLPDTERNRLKALLKEIVPESAGVIVRTAAEGASEEELTRDVERLTARWSDIESKVAKGNAPELLYGEPDLTLKVVRDLFTEDFAKLVVSGDDAWDMVDGYVEHVAPDLADRLERYSGDDVFADYRIDEQIAKGLDRKVWLPSGGSLIIDRTEAMTVVDVNTGKFTGSGGNLEETVTKNNLEAAEEIVRQLRLRDIGGIIVVDFIDMVLESNRDLVLRRLLECLGRDRTRHQVAEVTSLGLVQMTRKRIGTGLLEAFSETCEHCQGRGLVLHHEPVETSRKQDEEPRRGRRGRSRGAEGGGNGGNGAKSSPSPKDIAAMARADKKTSDASDAGDRPADAVADLGADGAEVTEPVPAPADEQAATGKGPERSQQPQQATTSDHEEPAEAAPAGVAPAESERAVETPADGQSGQQPAQQPAQHSDEPAQEPAAPAAPRVVTSTRRRVARRPAGPPSGAVAVAEPTTATAATGVDGTGSVDAGGASEPAVDGEPAETPHVPVKKKGSRKR